VSRRIYDGQLAAELAGDDDDRYERLRDMARALVGIVREGLVRDGEVRIHGFGTFRLRRIAPRAGYNPRTGERVTYPARNRVYFRPAKALRDRVEPRPAPATLAEPQPSREAALAAASLGAPYLYPVPAVRAPRTGPAPTGHAAGTPAADHEGSREAMLAGSAPPPTRPAGGLAVLGPGASSTSQRTGDETAFASREALLGASAARRSATDGAAAVDVKPGGYGAQGREKIESSGGDEGHRMARFASAAPPLNERAGDDAARSRAAGSDQESAPRAAESSPHEVAGPGGDAGGEPPESAPQRRRQGFWAVVVLVILLLAVALWLLWPSSGQRPVTAGGNDDTVASAQEQAGGDTGDAQASGGDGGPASAEADGDGGAASASDNGEATSTTTGDVGEGSDAADGGDQGTAPASAGDTASGGAASSAESGDGGSKSQPANGSAPASAEEIEAEGATAAGDAEAATGAQASGEPFFAGRDYTVESGDTLWGLADRHYANPFFWPHIWNNNDAIANPDRISVDQALWLPTLQGEPRNLTAADRRSIAQGYMQLYRFFEETGAGNPIYALVGVRFFDPSVLPERLRGSAAVKPNTALAAAFKARLESRFGER